MKVNIYGIQADHSIMCGYVCLGIIDIIFNNKIPVDFTNLLSPKIFYKTILEQYLNVFSNLLLFNNNGRPFATQNYYFFIGETLEKEQMIKWSICKFPSNFLYINLVVLSIASESITTA